jgi:predicted transglutaminase-like cysteine proteinase
MSTKTTFKRVALVAVAALGFGVVSVAPSSAIISGLTLTVNNGGTGTIRYGETAKIDADTSTAASVTVSALHTSQSDTTTIAFYLKSAPALATSTKAYLSLSDTTTTYTRVSLGDKGAGSFAGVTRNKHAGFAAATDSVTAGNPMRLVAGYAAGDIGNIGGTFSLNLDSSTSSGWTSGTYTYTVVATTYSNNGSDVYTVASTSSDVSIVVSKNASQSVAPVASTATAYIAASGTPVADSAVSAVSTADTTVDAVIYVKIFNAAGEQSGVQDSITATVTGAGLVSFDNSTYGKSVTYAGTGGPYTISVRGDGTAGSSSIAVSTKSGASWTKTMTFYAKAAKTLTATVATPVLGLGANASAVSVAAVDANGTNWTGTAYIVASAAADALVGGSATTPVQCAAWNADDGILCPITTIAVGTAKFKVIDASTVAAATATSNEVTVTVSNAAPATVKLSFDKATYAPFEKATITLTPLDKDGKAVAAQTAAALVTTAGITSTYAFSAGSDTLTAAGGITTSALTGVKKYTVYMPGTGDVKITATGGTALPISGQVEVSATASVVNSSVDAATDAANEATDAANAATDAALAAADAADAATAAAQDAADAVAALSASVSKMIASLKAQITSLTNLVIKIQKKVRA